MLRTLPRIPLVMVLLLAVLPISGCKEGPARWDPVGKNSYLAQSLKLGGDAVVISGILDPFTGTKLPFIVFAPSEEDDHFDGQMLCINDYKEEFIERDLVMVEVVGHGESRSAGELLSAVEVDALRKRYGVGEDEFTAILIGRDGVEKRRWNAPVPPAELYEAVDEVERGEQRAESASVRM